MLGLNYDNLPVDLGETNVELFALLVPCNALHGKQSSLGKQLNG